MVLYIYYSLIDLGTDAQGIFRLSGGAGEMKTYTDILDDGFF